MDVFLHTIDPGKSCSLTVKYVASSYYICMCMQIHKSGITQFSEELCHCHGGYYALNFVNSIVNR